MQLTVASQVNDPGTEIVEWRERELSHGSEWAVHNLCILQAEQLRKRLYPEIELFWCDVM